MISLPKIFRIVFLFILLLSACTPTTAVANTPRVNATEELSVKETPTLAVSKLNIKKEALRGVQVKIWHPWFGAQAGLFESQVAQFNKENEWGIVVSAVGKENYSELYSQTTNALKDASNPQVVIAFPEHALGWDDKVVDLNAYLHDPDYGMSALDISDFANPIWMQDEVNGKRFGMPAQRTARFIFYNQTWARELGFNAPPKTSADFETQACAAHTALGKDTDPNNDALGGWLIDSDAMTALSWMQAFGNGAQEEKGYRFLTPSNVTLFKYLKVLQQKSCAWVASTDTSVYDRFAARQALFSTGNLEDIIDQSRVFLTAGNKDEWTVLPFSGNEGQAVVVYGSSFVMFKSDDATQLAAWLFMRWMLSPESQARWVQSTGLFPLRTSTMNLLADYPGV